MPLELEQLYKLGTDVAAFLFFHPESLKHRAEDEIGWWDRDFIQEFTAGTLVAFSTGTDREFTMRFVQRPLTKNEISVAVSSADFRFEVRAGRFYWDNANALPCEDQLDDAMDDENGWVHIDSGLYRLTVYALDWFSVAQSIRDSVGDISHYIVRLEPVTSFDEIPVPHEIPCLMPSFSWHENRLAQLAKKGDVSL